MSESMMIADSEIEYIFNNQGDSSVGLANQVSFDAPGGRSAAPTGTLQIDDFMKVKKQRATYHTSYVVQNPFKLDMSWSEVEQEPDTSFKIKDLADTSTSIETSVAAPQSLHLIKVPIKVEILGEIVSKSSANGGMVPVSTLKLEKPV